MRLESELKGVGGQGWKIEQKWELDDDSNLNDDSILKNGSTLPSMAWEIFSS